jgi:hypothetical protein
MKNRLIKIVTGLLLLAGMGVEIQAENAAKLFKKDKSQTDGLIEESGMSVKLIYMHESSSTIVKIDNYKGVEIKSL